MAVTFSVPPRGVATGWFRGTMNLQHSPRPLPPPTHTHTPRSSPRNSLFEPKKDQKFQFQTSEVLLYTDAQKLYGPEILTV